VKTPGFISAITGVWPAVTPYSPLMPGTFTEVTTFDQLEKKGKKGKNINTVNNIYN
jgi:hypothetical protein